MRGDRRSPHRWRRATPRRAGEGAVGVKVGLALQQATDAKVCDGSICTLDASSLSEGAHCRRSSSIRSDPQASAA